MKKLILALTMFCTLSEHLCAMEKKSESTSPVSYTVPKEIDRDQLIRSSVIVNCGGNTSTGIAYGDRYIITGAHNVAGNFLNGCKITGYAVKSVEPAYVAPVFKQSYTDEEGRIGYFPDLSACKKLRELNIIKTHIHPETNFKVVDKPKLNNGTFSIFSIILEKYPEAMDYGISSVENYASKGVISTFMKVGETDGTKCRVFGPDVTLLECDKPHGLPTFEISDPIQDERSLVHILGLAGRRYQNDNSSQMTGGVVHPVKMPSGKFAPLFVVQPKIYGQRFKCLPAYSSGLKCWSNRPFMKIIREMEYLLEPEVYPKAPDGFGLIATGDSGAGGIVVKDGVPYLVGVVSVGEINPCFISIQDLLPTLSMNFDLLSEEDRRKSEEMRGLYIESLKANVHDPVERNKRWFITQGLADLTHLKPWIQSVVFKSSQVSESMNLMES